MSLPRARRRLLQQPAKGWHAIPGDGCHGAGPRRGCVRHDDRGGAMSAVRSSEQEQEEAPPAPSNGQQPKAGGSGGSSATDRLLAELLEALRLASAGQADVRLSTRRSGIGKEVAQAFNGFMQITNRYNRELLRVSRAVGREGRTTERIDMGPVTGMWVTRAAAVNTLIDDLVRPTNEVARVI